MRAKSWQEEIAASGRVAAVKVRGTHTAIDREDGHNVYGDQFDDREVRGPRDSDGSWRDDAACLDADPDLFFPGRGGAGVYRKGLKNYGESVIGREIRDLCFSCPVRLECLNYGALVWMPRMGWWGGHPHSERQRIRNLVIEQGWTVEAASKQVSEEVAKKFDSTG